MPILGKRLRRTDAGTLEETGEWVTLTDKAREQGMYVVGTTGTGKTTFLKSLIYQDMIAGEGLCVIDPHGDMIDQLLTLVPKNRRRDVILFAPGDDDQRQQPLGVNVLACNRDDDKQVQRITSTVIDTLRKLFSYSWGPRMEDLLRNSILTLMETPDSTFLDLWLLLASPLHRFRYIKTNPGTRTSGLQDEYLRQFWDVQFEGYTKNARTLIELVGSSLNKIGRFLADPRMRRIMGQSETAFSLREIMDERKILLVNLSKGDLGEDNSALLGSVLVNLILIAALTRRDIPPQNRVPFHLYVDEFQSFAHSDTFSILQSEARKYAIDTVVAHQYRDQLDDLNRGSTLNAGNFVVLRVTGIDAGELATQFDNTPPKPDLIWEYERRPYDDPQRAGYFWPDHEYQYPVPGARRLYNDMASERANTLAGQENLQAQARIVEGRKLVEHYIQIEPLEMQFSVEPDEDTARIIREQSLKLGTPRQTVDEAIKQRIGEALTFDFVPAPERWAIEESEE